MKSYEQVLAMAEALGDDAYVHGCNDKIFVEFNDFEGFDEDGSEIMRDYDNAVAVKAFEKMLRKEALKIDNDFYTTYYFDGFIVKTAYESYIL